MRILRIFVAFVLVIACVVTIVGCGGGGGSANEPSHVVEPVIVADIASVTAVTSGWWYSCAIDLSGQAWCWGANDYGQLGCSADSVPATDTGIPYTAKPCAVNSVTQPVRLTSIAAGTVETCGLDPSGSAICWGYGVPLDPVREPIGPTPVNTTERFTLLRGRIGNAGMCGLNQSGARYCWGTGETTSERLIPYLQDDSGLQFVDLALSQGWGCGVTAEAEAWCWGSNWFGQLGIGTVGQFDGPSESKVPVRVVGDHSFVAIAAGGMHACALDSEGAVWCWGLIPGNDTSNGTPQPVPGSQRFSSIFAGGLFTCGLDNDGKAWCWGLGPFGELGNGGNSDSLAPVAVAGGLYFSTLALGGVHACGITTDQQLYCWGSNEFGQLGHP